MSPYLEDFIAELFGITAELRELQQRHYALAPLFSVKRRFVFKKAASGMTPEKVGRARRPALAATLQMFLQEPLTESSFVDHVSKWLDDEPAHAEQLKVAAQYAAWAALVAGRTGEASRGRSFQAARRSSTRCIWCPSRRSRSTGARRPSGFIPRTGASAKGSHLPIPAPIWPARSTRRAIASSATTRARTVAPPAFGRKTGEFKKSVFGVTLAGCPLDEKISEMHVVKQEGNPIGALAIVDDRQSRCAPAPATASAMTA